MFVLNVVTILCDVTPALFRKVPLFVVQATVNVTLQMIRAVKLVALPKHCQILCDCRESMTVLSTLIVAAEARESDLHDIDGRKQRCLGTSTDSFVFICCPMWLRLCLSLFFNVAVLPFFIWLNAFLSLPFAGTATGIFELSGGSQEKKAWFEENASKNRGTKE